MTASPLNDVSDTAFWIAQLRADETARVDALFRDPLAGLLAGDLGRRIAETMPLSQVVPWSVAIRTCIIDDYVQAAVAGGVDTVLNLGAGLDARPYRMALPPTLHWIEADHPHIIDYKTNVLASEQPHCTVERVGIDLADVGARRRMLARVNEQAQTLQILSEGVVAYLSNDDVAALADDLRSMTHAEFWIVEYFSATAMRFRLRTRMAQAMQNAEFKFSPSERFGFLRLHGWEPREIRYLPVRPNVCDDPFRYRR